MPDMAVRTAFTATDKLSPAFKKMSGQADKFGKTAKKSFKSASGGARGLGAVLGSFKGIFAGLGVAMAARQAKQAVIDFAKAGDEAAKTGRRIGITAEQLQEFQFAADRAGVSGVETIKSFEKLNKNVGDLRAGTGSLNTILKKSNPELLKQLQNVNSNEEAFNLITKAVNSLPNQLDKASLAQAAFGRSGLKMLTVMEGGIEGISALRKEARKYGGVISNEAAAKSEQFIDAMTNMKFAFKGLGMSVLTSAITPLTGLMQKAADYFAANRGLISEQLGMWINNIKSAFQTALPFLKLFWTITKGLVTVFLKLFNILKPFLPIIFSLIAAWKIYAALQTVIATVTTIATMAQIAYGLATNATTASAIAYTAAQWAANAALLAFPAVLIIAGIAALILAIVWLVKNWDMVKVKVIEVWNKIKIAVSNGVNAIIGFFQRWGNVIIALTGPFAPLIAIITSLFTRWNEVVAAFKSGGIIGAIKQIGVIIMQSLLIPLKGALQLLSKLPGVGNVAKNALAGLNQMTAQAPQPPSPEAPNSAEVQSRYYQNTTVNVNNAQPGTSASVTPKKSATINYNMIGANP